jgi:hypothetical protein
MSTDDASLSVMIIEEVVDRVHRGRRGSPRTEVGGGVDEVGAESTGGARDHEQLGERPHPAVLATEARVDDAAGEPGVVERHELGARVAEVLVAVVSSAELAEQLARVRLHPALLAGVGEQVHEDACHRGVTS